MTRKGIDLKKEAKEMNLQTAITNHPERVVINIIIVIIGLQGRALLAMRDTTAVGITAVAIHLLLNLLLLIVGAEAVNLRLPLQKDTGRGTREEEEIIAATIRGEVLLPILTCIHTFKREKLSTQ